MTPQLGTPKARLRRRYFRHAEDAQRQALAIKTGTDQLVFFVQTAVVGFGVAWASVAAGMRFGRQEATYIVAGGFLLLSFAAGCGYIRCRTWNAFLRLFSTALPVIAAMDMKDVPVEKRPGAAVVLEQAGKLVDEHGKLMFDWAENFRTAQWVCLFSAVVYFIAWLVIRAI